MKKPVVLCDLDGIVADLLTLWLERYAADSGVVKSIADIDKFDIHECVPCGRDIYKYIAGAGLYSDLKPIAGAVEACKWMDEHCDLIILSTPSRAPATAAEKIQWCAKWLPFIGRRQIMLGARKELVHGDFFIDDSPENLEKWTAAHPGRLAMSIWYPYSVVAPGRWMLFKDWEHPLEAWADMTEYIGDCM